MSNNTNIASNWAGFRKLWIIVAILLLLLLLLMMLFGYGPWGSKCKVAPTVVEKTVEIEKVVDNPELKKRISMLEKENSKIAGLKSNLEDLTKKAGLVAGLQAKVKALEAVDPNFEDPALKSRITLLETENASIDGLKKRITELEAGDTAGKVDSSALKKRISELETENGLIDKLKTKVAKLEAGKVDENKDLMQKIKTLEAKNLEIPTLESRIKELESQEPKVMTKEVDNPALVKKIGELEAQAALIPGLKAKVKALEAVDINFVKSDDSNATTQNQSEASNMSKPSDAKLYFNSGSSRSPQDPIQALPKVIDYLKANPASTVSITGFHDIAGNARWNRRLANKRSNRIKQLLLDSGIIESRVKIEIPSRTLGTGLPKEARRVEVKVFN